MRFLSKLDKKAKICSRLMILTNNKIILLIPLRYRHKIFELYSLYDLSTL